MENIVFTGKINEELQQMLREIVEDDIFILVDTETYRYCLPLLPCLASVEKSHIIVVGSGEHHKSLESASEIWSVLSVQLAKRNSVLLNLGGGMITDLGGFSASCFKRGMRYINIPTTLLAQVDASIGGKTGIDFNGLKNEIGTFSQPEKVIVDPVFLTTLPERQFLSGFAEMIKHALLSGLDSLEELLHTTPLELSGAMPLERIEKSVNVKYQIVKNDPYEKGERKALNFGHTAGHAYESLAFLRGEKLYHGEAVAQGILFELYLSVQKEGFDKTLFSRVCKYISEIYPPQMSEINHYELYRLMTHDKKNEREGVNFTLLKAPGKFITDCYCSEEELLVFLESFQHIVWTGE
ncbi:3-dehydroquinate synthase [Porphyromonadaceae bacterium OttesenSCG-928-L07]|nr:3-dehydroquinate synthase [Porphyromonadaceae bacterium OttesenSCG-928-L07]MDL2251868.1 3-dehydroquinate synthase [Odoribacter sp. OttesenSCG-928-J03]MDL2330557.1 3-dehydroquinate synthase [Odoribacter sp. OttesenSCG-928-A06]